MSEEEFQEYDDDLVALLEAVWGEGFMSPGGTDEVDRYLGSIDLSGATVLDIGCGLGGMDLHLVKRHGASKVTGIDVEPDLIPRCQKLAQKYDVANALEFIAVDPGPLPFLEASFDVVTSKDSIIHIADKRALAAEIFRVLRPGGYFAASDWLAGYDGDPSPEMEAYIAAEGLDFGLASAKTYRDAMEAVGFKDIETIDRNAWYRDEARRERDQLRGALYESLAGQVGKEFLEHQIDVWNKLVVVADRGELCPTHLRGRKPA